MSRSMDFDAMSVRYGYAAHMRRFVEALRRTIRIRHHRWELHSASRLLPVILDADDGVVENDDAGQVGGRQGDVVLGSVR